MSETSAGTVAALWRYPIKSLAGEPLAATTIGARGVAGDRALALVDRATGKVASIKSPRLWGALLACRVTGPAPDVTITLPDGTVVRTSGADAALSALLGRDVALIATKPEGAQIDKEWPDTEGMPIRATLTTQALGHAAPPGTFFDYAPLHLVTTATLARLRALAPDGDFDARRFRPNLLIDTGAAEGFVENEWVGNVIKLGADVRLRIIDPAPRCVVTTLAQDELPHNPGILRAIAAHSRVPVPTLGGAAWPCVGVYGVVESGGAVALGDGVCVER